MINNSFGLIPAKDFSIYLDFCLWRLLLDS